MKQSVFKLLLESGFFQDQFEKVLNSMESINFQQFVGNTEQLQLNDKSPEKHIGIDVNHNLNKVIRSIFLLISVQRDFQKSII